MVALACGTNVDRCDGAGEGFDVMAVEDEIGRRQNGHVTHMQLLAAGLTPEWNPSSSRHRARPA
jgi:hypothetical protein